MKTDLRSVRSMIGIAFITGVTVCLPYNPVCNEVSDELFEISQKGSTIRNLIKSFQGETVASKKYAAFAWKATAEGYPEIALLFNAISNSEHVHAGNYKNLLIKAGVAIPEVKLRFEVRSTADNLRQAISGESLEVSRTYPEFMAVANHDGNQKALEYFNHAYKAEIKHKKFFENALSALLAQITRDLPVEYNVCQVCGNTYDTQAPVRCAICSSSRDHFLQVIGYTK